MSATKENCKGWLRQLFSLVWFQAFGKIQEAFFYVRHRKISHQGSGSNGDDLLSMDRLFQLVFDGSHISQCLLPAVVFHHGQVTLDFQNLIHVFAQKVDQRIPPEEALEHPDHPLDQQIMGLKVLQFMAQDMKQFFFRIFLAWQKDLSSEQSNSTRCGPNQSNTTLESE